MTKRSNGKMNYLFKERISEQLITKHTIDHQSLVKQAVDTQEINKQRIIKQENDEQLITKQNINHQSLIKQAVDTQEINKQRIIRQENDEQLITKQNINHQSLIKQAVKTQEISKQTIEEQDIVKQFIKKRVIEEEIIKENLPFPFTFQHLKDYLNLERNSKISKYKTRISIGFLLFVFCSFLYDFYFLEENIKYEDISNFFHNKVTFWIIFYVIIAYIFNLISARVIRNWVYASLGVEKYKVGTFSLFCKGSDRSWEETLIDILTPDLYFSKSYKKGIEKDDKISFEKNFEYQDFYKRSPIALNKIRINNKAFIQRTNWANVMFSFIFTFIIYSILIIFDLFRQPIFSFFIAQFFLTFLILRLISRGAEVMVAFYKDVVRTNEKLFFKTKKADGSRIVETKFIQDYKNSTLLPKARISLAVHSLVEFNVLFATSYYLFYKLLSSISKEYFETMPSIEMPYIETLLYSSTLGVFNISYTASSNILLNGLHFWQVMISFVLILIAVSQYMGLNKSLNNEEELFYKHIQLYSLKERNPKDYKEIFSGIKKNDGMEIENPYLDEKINDILNNEIDAYLMKFYCLELDTIVKEAENKEELEKILKLELQKILNKELF